MNRRVHESPADELVVFQDVSLCYPDPLRRHHYTLKDVFMGPRALFRKQAMKPVLHHIDFALNRGERVGVVGINGAGKSSFLQLIARIFPPTTGRIRIQGRVLPLIRLDAGFHPDLTGRENVVLASMFHGRMTGETHASMEQILDFADIGRAIDAPVRTYSTGMRTRLAFAVASSLPFDVLLIDEVLSVGDSKFQQKCSAWMASIDWSEKAMLYVSHNLDSVQRLTGETMWISNGNIACRGPSARIVPYYKKWLGIG